MRVAVYHNNKDVRLEEQPKPEPGPGELLIKIHASGICGSDVMEWYRIKKAPLVLGHEIAGEVEATGDGVTAFKKGDRVFATHHVPCDECYYCASGHETVCDTLKTTKFYPGGFSEYVRVPEINVQKGTLKLPEGLTYDEGTFIEPLGCVIRGQRIAGMKSGLTVLVLGSGISGILHIKLAKASGASKIFSTDVNDFRLDFAKKCGAETIKATDDVVAKLKASNDGRLADLVILCTAAPAAVKQAYQCVDKGGTILLFAMADPNGEFPSPPPDLWSKLVTITSSYAAVREELQEAIELLKTKKVAVNDMITHRLPLEKTQEGFALVSAAQDSLKVIIEPQK